MQGGKRRTWCFATYLLFFFLASCKIFQGKTSSPTHDYVEDGVRWAHGQVELAPLSAPGVIYGRLTTSQAGTESLELIGFPLGFGPVKGPVPVRYADISATEAATLSYVHEVKLLAIPRQASGWEIALQLKKPGGTFPDTAALIIGKIHDPTATNFQPVHLLSNMHVAQIKGDADQAWAVHPLVREDLVPDPRLTKPCSTDWRRPTAQPLRQFPQQETPCQLFADPTHLCRNRPLSAECSALLPTTTPAPNRFSIVEGAEKVADTSQVLQVAGGKPARFKISALNAASSTDRSACESQLIVVGRTLDNLVNDRCDSRIVETISNQTKLTCVVEVNMGTAGDWSEEFCKLMAIFKGEEAEPLTLILRQT